MDLMHIMDNGQENFLTTVEYIKSLRRLSQVQQDAFRTAKIEEIQFILSTAVTPIPGAATTVRDKPL